MLHGRHGRNVQCFNCHDPENLDTLKTRDGRSLKWAESTQLCASCHGPTYRDWEIGIHGRVSGHWDRSRGPQQRVECASCHHPHAPQFPSLPPAPAPRGLHEKSGDQNSNSHSNEPASHNWGARPPQAQSAAPSRLTPASENFEPFRAVQGRNVRGEGAPNSSRGGCAPREIELNCSGSGTRLG